LTEEQPVSLGHVEVEVHGLQLLENDAARAVRRWASANPVVPGKNKIHKRMIARTCSEFE